MPALIGYTSDTHELKLAISASDQQLLKEREAAHPNLVYFRPDKIPKYLQFYVFDGVNMNKSATFDADVEAYEQAEVARKEAEAIEMARLARQQPVTVREFKSRFTAAEYRAISVAAQTNDDLFQFWDIVNSVAVVELDHPQTVQGMTLLVGLGLITQGRSDSITGII